MSVFVTRSINTEQTAQLSQHWAGQRTVVQKGGAAVTVVQGRGWDGGAGAGRGGAGTVVQGRTGTVARSGAGAGAAQDVPCRSRQHAADRPAPGCGQRPDSRRRGEGEGTGGLLSDTPPPPRHTTPRHSGAASQQRGWQTAYYPAITETRNYPSRGRLQ